MDIIDTMLTDRDVYWPILRDGDGQVVTNGGLPVFDSPVETRTRWEEKTEEFVDRAGDTLSSKAVVFTDIDTEEGGVLWHSGLKWDETGDGAALLELISTEDPFQNSNAWQIRGREKIPTLEGDEYIRRSYL